MNLGFQELVIIGIIVLLIFGPKRLPELAKGLGKGIRDFKKAVEGGDEENKQKLPPTIDLASPEEQKEKDSIKKS